MQLAGLSLDQAPPISVPFRFFLSAPLFVTLAALLLWVAGPDALVSRWTPAMLAATHLLTLGFMAMVMIGAMLQMLPVVASSPVFQSRLIAWLVHPLLSAGTGLLAIGFYISQPRFILLAMPLLLIGFAVFIVAGAFSLARAPVNNATITAMRLALFALVVTVTLGALLVMAVNGYASVPVLQLTGVHAVWGLAGWVGLLLIGVAYQVVPMFQLTPLYPKSLTRWLTWAVFLLLVLWSAAMQNGKTGWLEILLSGGLAFAFASFAVITLYLQSRRRRRIPDITMQFWRAGMASLLIAIVIGVAGQLVPEFSTFRVYPLLLGVLLVAGFAVSMISGMLYKIVPFLVWFHLHGKRHAGSDVPNMKEIISDRHGWQQLRLHVLSVVLLLLMVCWPSGWLTASASLALAASSLLLWLNILRAGRLYAKCSGKTESV